MGQVAEMLVFVRVAESCSLSAASRALGMSPAGVSKRIARLEERLGVRLLNRTSRHLSLTEAGGIYLKHCREILADIADAEAAISGHRPRGSVKVTAPNALGRRWLARQASRFAEQYPEVSVHICLNDAVVDLLEGGFDLGLRVGVLKDSRLVFRKMASNLRVVCGAPAYFEKFGVPRCPDDLLSHNCLVLTAGGVPAADWTYLQDGRQGTVRVSGTLSADSGDVLQDWALAGEGLVVKSLFDVAEDIEQGRLRPVLQDYIAIESDIHIVYPSRKYLPAKTRLFMEFLIENAEADSRNWRQKMLGSNLGGSIFRSGNGDLDANGDLNETDSGGVAGH